MPPLAGPRISSPGPAAQTRAPCGRRGASVLVSKRALRAAERALRKPRGSPSRHGRGPGPVPADSHHCGALTPALPTVGVETALPGATLAPGLVQGATPQCPPAKEPDLPGGWGPERARPEAAKLPATMSSGRTARPGARPDSPWGRRAAAVATCRAGPGPASRPLPVPARVASEQRLPSSRHVAALRAAARRPACVWKRGAVGLRRVRPAAEGHTRRA